MPNWKNADSSVNRRNKPMAVSLPISAAVDVTPTGTKVRPPALAATKPAVGMPLAFMLTGVSALFAGCVWFVIQPAVLAIYHYNQSVIAVTHLFVLGCFCSIVMGAMYQLVPVALETK